MTKVHDFRTWAWGHTVTLFPSQKTTRVGSLVGCATPRPEEGDFIAIKNGELTSLLRCSQVEHDDNPRDGFSAKYLGVVSLQSDKDLSDITDFDELIETHNRFAKEDGLEA